MPGIFPQMDTLIAAVAEYDVDRPLTMGVGAALEFWVPDAAALVEPVGMRLVRRYERAFNRDTDAERERGDGQTIVFVLADYLFPVGQVRADLAQKQLHLRFYNTPTEGPFGFHPVNKVEAPAESEAQIYTIIAQTRTFKQTYRGRA